MNQNYIDTVVDWLFDEWGKKEHHYNKNFWDSWVKSSLSLQDVPQTYIAVENSSIIGTFSIWRCDVQSRQDLFPWLGGIVVRKDCRNKGVGKHMINEAIRIVRQLGYKELYLSTPLVKYYDSLGWKFIKNIPDENGKLLRLYHYDLYKNTED
ncbi:MAG: GNAT family N-acetyltransferase [Ruminococcus sp.]|nr:GNAT family N-acetyltransferase [Ruminococcus sp.]